ncbi:50S ribosomal protein L18 [Candidatus Kaiserbacteria bacterium RIFCSPHIGHO2_01_FULL_48_10]|uniref:Large ribosomal subunit protein uL18 n=1 Tax=Candidatus Kaiserbacteria bacterium RIFCSPHIGHO2_01_FULL_48_10 TaxID=1798476 RepID=A0A1F6C5U6_9BACT|nr:MAG: 50S ribosomal protein L18 [Candidatus Kaiserbacteria bacterium RIFCSPHIGHO2_01_FULL_48_10]
MSKLTPKTKAELRARRHARIRATLYGTAARPRLSVFRSNKYLYAQIIDDEKGVTLASADSRKAKGKGMIADAKIVGEQIAKAAVAAGVTKVVFDRGGFGYAGVIKMLADSARGGGLQF